MGKLMSVKEFSNNYGIGINSAYRMSNIDGFPRLKIGRRIFIVKSKVDDWIINNIGNQF